MTKLTLAILAGALVALSQTTLPQVSTVTSANVTCTFSVADAQMSVATECLAADGTILKRAVDTPQTKGALLGTGPILCLVWTDGAPTPTVRLQCSADDDSATGPRVVLDGKLAPVAKKRQWWVFWR